MKNVFRVSWGLLGEWWCCEEALSTDDVARVVLKEHDCAGWPAPAAALIRDRLRGGFGCAEEEGRRHIYFGTGHYTYMNPEANTPLSAEEREGQWAELIADNAGERAGAYVGGGPCCEDAPTASAAQ